METRGRNMIFNEPIRPISNPMPQSWVRQIDQIAASRQVKRSVVMREAISTYISAHQKPPSAS